MKKHFLLVGILFLISAQIGFSESCYLLIEKTGSFDQSTIFEVSSALLAQFVEPVQEFPPAGVGKKDCLYRINVLEDPHTLSVSISGRHSGGIGNSEKKGIIGLQQSILRAFLGNDAEARVDICHAYKILLEKECENAEALKSEVEQRMPEEEKDIWHLRYEDDDVTIYLSFKNDKVIEICSLEVEEYNFERIKIKDDIVTWDEQEYEIKYEDEQLLLEGKDTYEFEYKDSASDVCHFYFYRNTLNTIDYEALEGIWFIEHDEVVSIYMQFNDDGEASICELKNGEIVDHSEGKIEDAHFIWEDDAGVPVMLKSDFLLIKGEDYVDILTKTDKAPQGCKYE